jgi:hypothetical protein
MNLAIANSIRIAEKAGSAAKPPATRVEMESARSARLSAVSNSQRSRGVREPICRAVRAQGEISLTSIS